MIPAAAGKEGARGAGDADGVAEPAILERARALGAGDDAVIATDTAGIVVYWNGAAERLYGWRAAEVVGKNIVEVTPSDLSRAEASRIMQVLREGRSWRGVFEVRTREGGTLAVDVTDAPVRGPSGELIGIIGVSRPAESGGADG